MFTTNQVKAAPVLWSQQVLTGGALRAVVLNSGGANACTGPEGFQATHATAEKAAEVLGCGAVEVAVCSTGLIGEQLPRGRAARRASTTAADELGAHAGGRAGRRDRGAHHRHPRQAGGYADRGRLDASAASPRAPACSPPRMATMLVGAHHRRGRRRRDLDAALRAAAGRTFDRLDVDGGTSTNDTVLLLASGASGVAPTPEELTAGVTAVCADLVPAAAGRRRGRDQARHDRGQRRRPARPTRSRSPARSPGTTWCKTAFFGSDPNWGRIAMAVGTPAAAVDPDRLDITINGVAVCRDGVAAGRPARGGPVRPRRSPSQIDLRRRRRRRARSCTTDLSHAYVEENSAYSS